MLPPPYLAGVSTAKFRVWHALAPYSHSMSLSSKFHRRASRSGIALVIVLGFLVILSALAIAFFSSVTTELKASRTYASTVTTRQLADTAVNVVMDQIREATTATQLNGTAVGTWASQPGMIRVYGGAGNATNRPYAFLQALLG